MFGHVIDPSAGLRVIAPSMVCIYDARLESAVYIVLRHQILDQRLGRFTNRPQGAGLIHAETIFKIRLINPLTGTDLSAIAAGSAPPDPVRLHNHDIIAFLRKVQRSRKSGEPCPNYTNIRRHLTFQNRVINGRRCRGCIPRRRKFSRLFIGI